MRLPRFLYTPLGIQLALEVIARLTPDNLYVNGGLIFITLALCAYAGAQGVLAMKPMIWSSLWTLPLTLLAFISGSLGFALDTAGYDPVVYSGFVLASTLFCIVGVATGLVGALWGHAIIRSKKGITR